MLIGEERYPFDLQTATQPMRQERPCYGLRATGYGYEVVREA